MNRAAIMNVTCQLCCTPGNVEISTELKKVSTAGGRGQGLLLIAEHPPHRPEQGSLSYKAGL